VQREDLIQHLKKYNGEGMKKKVNCWEFHECGRVHGGENVEEFGVCPATVETTLDGVHDGTNGGRACWVIAGTFCMGTVQGMFAKKYETCKQCEFYKLVHNENSNNFFVSLSLLQKIQKKQEIIEPRF
jgi:hypothetical protein